MKSLLMTKTFRWYEEGETDGHVICNKLKLPINNQTSHTMIKNNVSLKSTMSISNTSGVTDAIQQPIQVFEEGNLRSDKRSIEINVPFSVTTQKINNMILDFSEIKHLVENKTELKRWLESSKQLLIMLTRPI